MGAANYMRIGEWAQLDLQSIQHRDQFGHLSIFDYLVSMKHILRQELLIMREPESGRSWTSKVFNTVISLDTYQFLICRKTLSVSYKLMIHFTRLRKRSIGKYLTTEAYTKIAHIDFFEIFSLRYDIQKKSQNSNFQLQVPI